MSIGIGRQGFSPWRIAAKYRQAAGAVAEAVMRSVELIVQPDALGDVCF
jgi:hypothetical protein